MATTGGSNGARPGLAFTRRALEENSRLIRSEFEDVNPHAFYRRLRDKMDRLRREEPAYEVVAERSRDLAVRPEAGGQRTGAFTGRLQARAETPAVGPARIDYRPWAPYGLLLVLAGLLAGLAGFLHGAGFVLAAGLALGGILAFSRQRRAEIPLERRDVVSVLFEGETREIVHRTSDGDRARLQARGGLLYAGEVFLTIRDDAIDELDWPVRAELTRRCELWSTALEEDDLEPAPEEGPQTGVLDGLTAWAHLDPNWAEQEIAGLQEEIRGSLSRRQAYADRLSRLRGEEAREGELERLRRELASLDAQVRAYVDRRVPPAGAADGRDGLDRRGTPSSDGVSPPAEPQPRGPRAVRHPPSRAARRPSGARGEGPRRS